MKRIGNCAAAALAVVVAISLLAPEPAWAWNPFAKTADPSAGKSTVLAPKSGETKKSANTRKPESAAKQAARLQKTADSASQADRAAAKRSPGASAKHLWSPVNDRYRWSAARQPSPARRAVTNTVNVLTFKPLRDKLSGNPTTHNPWSQAPPVTNTSAKKRPGMLGSLFKPKPKKKTGPQTVSEWISQDRPGF
ncbi:MAG TPA: hypothetical protein VIK18_25060 [Pirellulales bacterium]